MTRSAERVLWYSSTDGSPNESRLREIFEDSGGMDILAEGPRTELGGEIVSSADCVLIDGTGSETNELETARSIRETDFEKPILLLVETVTEDRLRKAMENGVDDIIPVSLLRHRPELFEERILRLAARDRDRPNEGHDEQELTRSEYEALFNSVSDGLVVHDPETGEMLAVNEPYCELTGYSESELVGSNIDLIVPEDPAYSFEEGLDRIEAVREDGPQLFEFKGQKKNGETFVGEVHLRRIEFRNRERVLASVRDITARKRREAEFEQIFNNVNDIISVYDPEAGDLTRVNDTMCAVTGYDRATILESGIGKISSEKAGFTAERAAEIIERVAEEETSRELEWGLETADGAFRWVEVHATPATINGEDRVLTISRDVTERKRSKKRLGAILDRIDDAVFLTKAHNISRPTRNPEYVSAGYEEIWGQTLDEIRERYNDGFFGTLHPEDKDAYEAFVRHVVEEIDAGDPENKYTTEYRVRRPDSERRWVESEFYPVEWEMGPPRIVIVSRDVTERKKHERRLASFEAATEDLTTADSPAEAARAAGEAAAETLDLPGVSVFLHDQTDGALEATYTSDSLSQSLDSLAVDPGAGLLWDAFGSGEIVGPDTTPGEEPLFGPESADFDRSKLADWRLIPLANHGSLFVAAFETGIPTETLQSAHILAATLEAALNHIRGRRRLASTESELETKTRRVKELDRIVSVTRRVEAAITTASGKAEVEREVCDRLVETGPYDLAWIGEIGAGTDRLEPSTVTGEAARFVASMSRRGSDPSTTDHPARRAWDGERVAVENVVVDATPQADWQRRLLQKGYQSVCAVPIRYNEITYGVLTVAAESPNSFDERTREVLAQLGTSIGHALAGIDRRRALESDDTVELEFSAEDPGLRLSRLAETTGATVRHERTISREGGAVNLHIALEDPAVESPIAEVKALFSDDVTVIREDSNSYLLAVEAETWFGAVVPEYGGVLEAAVARPEQTTITVEIPAHSDVRAFASRLQEQAPTLELQAKRQRKQAAAETLRSRLENRLTDRQLEVLETAYEAGYFEWPREKDGGEVAERLDITQPTMNKHLRLAERKTFEELLTD